ncbi:methyltransferase [Paenibacillus tyrfis]|uniref:TRM11 family SAM-dependent methyltransferase n=1 Tax=Paenibacillus tyrfis TaxID=1501230 RepID=UPI0024913CA6|nr:RNA methyltransferase [Paenibacillus tyrfis]GLI08478.1 methyltransferase [Paenibacillus tyrfis]
MKLSGTRPVSYLYTYACHEDEAELCALELRTLLGAEAQDGWLESPADVDPSRSPFVKQRVDVLCEADSLQALGELAGTLELDGGSFKVVFVKAGHYAAYEDQRAMERELGARIRGRADMRQPDWLLGFACNGEGRWVLGPCRQNEAVWLKHSRKPHNYSTALSTRVARAVANLAVPQPAGIRAVDPCCGIGTVLVEALSMGIDIVGSDINPLAVRGARANLAHFGLPDVVRVADIGDVSGRYDAAVLDLPYNLCSVISPEEQLRLLGNVRRLAERAVIVSTEPVETLVGQAGFAVLERCVVRKGSFSRHIVICR